MQNYSSYENIVLKIVHIFYTILKICPRKIIRDCLKCRKMAEMLKKYRLNAFKCPKNGLKWPRNEWKVAENVQKWSKNGSKWPKNELKVAKNEMELHKNGLKQPKNGLEYKWIDMA